jgi:hypothetical protein
MFFSYMSTLVRGHGPHYTWLFVFWRFQPPDALYMLSRLYRKVNPFRSNLLLLKMKGTPSPMTHQGHSAKMSFYSSIAGCPRITPVCVIGIISKNGQPSDDKKIGKSLISAKSGGGQSDFRKEQKKCQSPGGYVSDLLRGNARKQSCWRQSASQSLNQALARPVGSTTCKRRPCDCFAPIVPVRVRWNLPAHAACLGWALHCY